MSAKLSRGQSEVLSSAILVAAALTIAIAVVSLTLNAMNRVQTQQLPPIVLDAQSKIRATIVSTYRTPTSVVVDVLVAPLAIGSKLPVCLVPIIVLNTSYDSALTSALEFSLVESGVLEPVTPLSILVIDASKVIVPASTGTTGYTTMEMLTKLPTVSYTCITVTNSTVWLELTLPPPSYYGVSTYILRLYLTTRAVTEVGELYAFAELGTNV